MSSKTSIILCTYNEADYIENAISELEKNIPNVEIVIVDDYSDKMTQRVFDVYKDDIKFYEHALNSDFSVHKNFMNDQCTGDWIFNIDADEIPHKNLVKNIKSLILHIFVIFLNFSKPFFVEDKHS